MAPFSSKTKPYQHQMQMLSFHVNRQHSAEWGDFEVGKSKVALDLIRWRLEEGQVKKAIT
jgi:hypothetical protein